METFYLEIIRKAFNRCYGLQDSLKRHAENHDEKMIDTCLDSLAYQSGTGKEFLKDHLHIIINLLKNRL